MGDRLFHRAVMGHLPADSGGFQAVTGTVYSDPWSMRDASIMSIEMTTRDGTGALQAVPVLQRSTHRRAVQDPTHPDVNWVDVPVAECQLPTFVGAEKNDVVELANVAAPAYRVKVPSTADGGLRIVVHSRGA